MIKGSLEGFLDNYIVKDIAKLENPKTRLVVLKDISSGSDYILKLSNIDHANVKSYINNFKDVKGLSHPNFIFHKNAVKLEDMHFDYNVAEILEYANSGTLIDYLKSDIMYSQVIEAFKQAFTGLNFLHERNILHRDIKATNLFVHQLDEKIVVKVGDLEFWKDHENISNRITPEYMAPEVELYTDYTLQSDFWAIGVMLYELFVGKYPFGSRLEGVDVETIRENGRKSLILVKSKIPPPFDEIVRCCLQVNTNKRPESIKELLKILESMQVI